jgi:hypothetical protein
MKGWTYVNTTSWRKGWRDGGASSLWETAYPNRALDEIEEVKSKNERTHSRFANSESLAIWRPVETSC